MAELRFGIFSPQKSGYIFNSAIRKRKLSKLYLTPSLKFHIRLLPSTGHGLRKYRNVVEILMIAVARNGAIIDSRDKRKEMDLASS